MVSLSANKAYGHRAYVSWRTPSLQQRYEITHTLREHICKSEAHAALIPY